VGAATNRKPRTGAILARPRVDLAPIPLNLLAAIGYIQPFQKMMKKLGCDEVCDVVGVVLTRADVWTCKRLTSGSGSANWGLVWGPFSFSHCLFLQGWAGVCRLCSWNGNDGNPRTVRRRARIEGCGWGGWMS